MNARVFRMLLLLAPALLGAPRGGAHWITQTNELKAGWNGVFLHVDPSHATISQLLAPDPNASIEEIWLWQVPASQQQFVQNPQVPTTGGSQWRSWKRIDVANSALQNLIPNAAYLVRVRSDVANGTYRWGVKGKATVPRYQWTTSGLNFVGFPTVPTTPPTFEDFLAQSPPDFQQIAEVFRYVGGDLRPGNPEQVFALRNVDVRRGEAFWVRSQNVYNRYYGPFEVVIGGAGVIALGDRGSVTSARLRNHSPSPLTVSLELVPSESIPSGQMAIAGVPPLIIRGAPNSTNLTHAYVTLPVGTPRTWTLAPFGQPGSDTEVILGVDRSALSGNPGDLFAGVLRFTDSLGLGRVEVGLSAAIGSNAGLWIGNAAVTQVGHYLKTFDRAADTRPSMDTNGAYVVVSTNTSLGGVPAPYPLRLIVHNPATGPATLFQQLFVGPNLATNPVVASRESVLAPNLLSQARRISTTHLPWSAENSGWRFNGGLAQGTTVTVSVTNRFDNHASNPFLHSYHPDHDNLDGRFVQEQQQGSESYTVVRDITLTFQAPTDDFSGRTSASQTLGGQYAETIRLFGLPRAGGTFDTRDFRVHGLFSLNRISEIATVTRP